MGDCVKFGIDKDVGFLFFVIGVVEMVFCGDVFIWLSNEWWEVDFVFFMSLLDVGFF